MIKIKEFFVSKRKILLRIVAALLVVSLAFGLFVFYDNFRLDVERIPISSSKLSECFDGFKIAHISDYHSRKSKIVND